MPLKTFYNLKEERKAIILKVSYEEFVYNPYKTASVTSIVKHLKLAKGSFYRYFKNKLDLYSYLVQRAHKLKLKHSGILRQNISSGFFEILRENFRNKIIFDTRHPLESILLFNLFQEVDSEELKYLYREIKAEELNLIKELVLQFQQNGQLNSYVDAEIAAQYIFQTQSGIYEYLHFYKEIDYKKNIKEGNRVFGLAEQEIMELVDKFLMVIMFGLEKRV